MTQAGTRQQNNRSGLGSPKCFRGTLQIRKRVDNIDGEESGEPLNDLLFNPSSLLHLHVYKVKNAIARRNMFILQSAVIVTER
jgi:hypothetical protein